MRLAVVDMYEVPAIVYFARTNFLYQLDSNVEKITLLKNISEVYKVVFYAYTLSDFFFLKIMLRKNY